MKFKVEHRLGIKAPAHLVWEIISDLATWREWNPLYPEAKGVIGFGERLILTEAPPGAPPRTIRPVVLDWAPDEAIHWQMSSMAGLLTSIHYLEIEKMHDTGCIFSNGELFDGLATSAIGRRTRRRIREGFTVMDEALRDHAEARWREAGWGAHIGLMIDDLYSTKILRLAANMPRAGRLAAPDASAEKVSKLCGSKIVIDVVVEDGKVVDFAQDVRACALGQAAAAVLGEHVIGASLDEIEVARDALRAMLKDNGPPPQGRFSELSVLAPVKDYPARHTSTLLAFEAAVEAVRKAQTRTGRRTSRAGAA